MKAGVVPDRQPVCRCYDKGYIFDGGKMSDIAQYLYLAHLLNKNIELHLFAYNAIS